MQIYFISNLTAVNTDVTIYTTRAPAFILKYCTSSRISESNCNCASFDKNRTVFGNSCTILELYQYWGPTLVYVVLLRA